MSSDERRVWPVFDVFWVSGLWQKAEVSRHLVWFLWSVSVCVRVWPGGHEMESCPHTQAQFTDYSLTLQCVLISVSSRLPARVFNWLIGVCVCSSPVCSLCSPNPSHHCSCGQQHYITASLAQRSPEPRSQHTPLPNPTRVALSPIKSVCLSARPSLDSDGKLMDALFLSHIKFQVTLFGILSRETSIFAFTSLC